MDVLRSSNESRLGVWFSSAIATRMPPHTHDAFEVNLVVAGRLTYRVGDVRLVVEPGECILLPQGVVHELLEASTDAAFWVLEGREMHPRLAGDMAARDTAEGDTAADGIAASDGAAGDGAAGDGAAGDGAASVLRLEAEDFRDLARLSRELWLRPKPTEVERLTLAIESRLGQLRPCPPSQVPHGGHAGVRRARRLAESIESEVLDVAELAREAGVSTSRLSHLFQDEVGVSPLQYLNYCRVQAFVRRWDGEQDNLLTAALAAGFGSYAKFHRVFSQVCGSSPRAHRRFLLEKSIDPSQRLGNVPPSQPPSQPPRVRATGWSSARV